MAVVTAAPVVVAFVSPVAPSVVGAAVVTGAAVEADANVGSPVKSAEMGTWREHDC